MKRVLFAAAVLGVGLALGAGGDGGVLGEEGGVIEGRRGEGGEGGIVHGEMGDGRMGDGMMGDGMMGGHEGDGADPGADHGADTPSTAAFMTAMDEMDRAMRAEAMTGEADEDFARLMIAHHQAAIDMAEVELLHGDDPAMRGVALRVIEEQTAEIAELTAWLEGERLGTEPQTEPQTEPGIDPQTGGHAP